MDWKEIVGHKNNIAYLQRMLKVDKVPHALLFNGTEGIGKYSVAKIFAQNLLCENGVCDSCPSCRAFAAGSHPDFFEVQPEKKGNGAGSIKIEQIQFLQEEISRVPYLAKRRVVIINEAEKMNSAASNRLLKVLEEPTGQVVFILVTSRLAAMLPTIVSRCTPLRFAALTAEELQGYLQQKGIPEDLAGDLAVLSEGSIGRVRELQEHGGMELREDAVLFLCRLKNFSLQDMWQQSKEKSEWPKEKCAEWLGYIKMALRDLLILYSGETRSTYFYHGSYLRQLSLLLQDYSVPQLLQAVRLLQSRQQRLQANVNLRLFWESFFIQLQDIRQI